MKQQFTIATKDETISMCVWRQSPLCHLVYSLVHTHEHGDIKQPPMAKRLLFVRNTTSTLINHVMKIVI